MCQCIPLPVRRVTRSVLKLPRSSPLYESFAHEFCYTNIRLAALLFLFLYSRVRSGNRERPDGAEPETAKARWRMLERTLLNARCTTHDTHSRSGRILTRSSIHHRFHPESSQPLPGLAVHLHTLPNSIPPYSPHATACARARATQAHHRCSLGSIHLLVVKWRGTAFTLSIARALRVQLHHLAARDYDALSGFESRSSD
jgi:hypothetical protein